MYNPQELVTAYQGVVGFLQSNIPGVPEIGAPLTDSTSGIYVQNKHALVSLENLYYCFPDCTPSAYPQWVSGRAYLAGAKVNSGNIIYLSTSAVTSTTPPASDSTNWGVYNPLQVLLQQKYNQGITNCFSEVVKLFKLQDSGKAIIERQQMFRGSGAWRDSITPRGNAVGFQIITQQAEALLVQIDQLGTQFMESQVLRFYLFHTSCVDAIKTFDVTVGGNSSFSWQTITDCIMMYLQQNTQGSYLFIYFEEDLIEGNMAISKSWNCSAVPCVDCTSDDLLMYNRWSRYTAFRNVKFPPAALDGYKLPDLNKAVIGSMTNWGLNFSLTVRCDLTDFIIYNKHLYADVIAMQVALECIKMMANTTRIDPASAQIKNQARAELYLGEPSTFINDYWKSIKALKIDMSGFSDSCQPCDKSNGKKTGSWVSV